MRFSCALLLVAAQLALIGAGLEGLGRIADPLGISYYSETARFFDRLVMEDRTGYRLGADPDRFVNSRTDPHCNREGCAILAAHIAHLLEAAGML